MRARRTWTEAKLAELRPLWAAGWPVPDIARRLGVDPASIRYAVNEFGLAPRGLGSSGGAWRAASALACRRKAEARRGAARPPAPPPPPPGELAPLVARLEALDAHACHWPIGDPQAGEAGFGWCGRARAAGAGPYCPEHQARAVDPRRAVAA